MTSKRKPYTTYTKEFKQDAVDEIYRWNNLPDPFFFDQTGSFL